MKKFLFSILCLFCMVSVSAETFTATYSVVSNTSVSSSGKLPSGSMATYEQTHGTTSQMTSGNSCTFTLAGYEGCRITGITLSMRSNKSTGAGSLLVEAGETTLCEIENSTFKAWYGGYSTTYVSVKPEMSYKDYTILKDENVVVHIAATENSLYCNGLSVEYERVVEVLAVPLLPEPGRFIASKEISLSCETKDATIYYTLDGGEPTAEYTEPFTITETTTVKAVSVKDDETSRVVEATYTMVEPSAWKLVTDADALNVSDKVVIVAAESEYAMSTTQNTNNRGRTLVVKCEDQLTIDENVQVLTLEEGKVDDTFAFYTGEEGYLYAPSSSSNHLKTKTEKDANGSWMITITGGVTSIVAQGTSTRNDLRHNAGDFLFSCYETTTTMKNVCLYYKATELKINGYGYATLFLDKAVAVPEGLTAYYCTVDGTTAVLHEVGEVIPAATGVVLRGTANTTYTLTNTAEKNDKAEAIRTENRLMGYTEDTDVSMGTDAYYALNAKDGVVGFFIPQTMSDEMNTFTAKANKAYLKLGGTVNVQMLSIRQGTGGDETVVENRLADSLTEEKVYYDLTGRRVDNPGRGIYIVNGKKVVIK